MAYNSSNMTMGEGIGVDITRAAAPTNVVNVNVEHYCEVYSQLSLVVTIPLSFVVLSILFGNFLIIFHSCRTQHPNSKPVHLPTVCFASGNLLIVLILLFLQVHITTNSSYSCGVVLIIEQFQILVVTFFCLHLLVATVRFCLVVCKPSAGLRETVLSPHIRTTLVVLWFQATSHCICVLVNLFIFKRMPPSLNLITFCLILAVPVLTVVLFVLSQAAKHYRQMRRYREWTGERFSHLPIDKECVVFKWALMTACILLLFWLPFWTKNVFDYLGSTESNFEAFDFYSWIVADILLLSNSMLIHLI